jgi:hypothetical protein
MSMTAEAGRRVHLADRTARFLVGQRDVVGQEVDAGDVEADGRRRPDRHLDVVGVHEVGHVDRRPAGREVPRRPQIDDLAGHGYRVLRVAEQLHQALGLVVDFDPGEDLLVPDAAPRIAVHFGHELLDRLLPVADHVAGNSPRRGHDLAVDHEDAVIEPGDEPLHDHAA